MIKKDIKKLKLKLGDIIDVTYYDEIDGRVKKQRAIIEDMNFEECYGRIDVLFFDDLQELETIWIDHIHKLDRVFDNKGSWKMKVIKETPADFVEPI